MPPRQRDRDGAGWLFPVLLGVTTAAIGFVAGWMANTETEKDSGAAPRKTANNSALRPETCQPATDSEPACPVCLDNRVDCVLIPCNHVVCQRCAVRLPSCPSCRAVVDTRERIFI